jgi:hypothetical protein
MEPITKKELVDFLTLKDKLNSRVYAIMVIVMTSDLKLQRYVNNSDWDKKGNWRFDDDMSKIISEICVHGSFDVIKVGFSIDYLYWSAEEIIQDIVKLNEAFLAAKKRDENEKAERKRKSDEWEYNRLKKIFDSK